MNSNKNRTVENFFPLAAFLPVLTTFGPFKKIFEPYKKLSQLSSVSSSSCCCLLILVLLLSLILGATGGKSTPTYSQTSYGY